MKSVKQRFWEKVDVREPHECWLWKGAVLTTGYGRFRESTNSPQQAHRVSYRWAKGTIPGGYVVRHTCDVKLCVNPDHLVIGTPTENVKDAHDRGRYAKGEGHPSSILTEEQVRMIRTVDLNTVQLSKLIGVSQSVIHGIRAGKSWRHVS